MKKIIALIFTGFCLFGWGQNQFHMSQSMLYQPFINPSVISSYNNLNGALFYKNQWTGFAGAPEIAGFSINSSIRESNHAVGLSLLSDQIGVSKNRDLSAMYSYKIQLSTNKFLSLGLSASMIMIQSDLAALDVIQQADPIFQANTPTFIMPNAKFGAYYFTDKFYFGFGVPNLMKNQISTIGIAQANTSFESENIHYYLHSGYLYELNKEWDLNASLLLKQVSGAPLQIGVNGQALYRDLLGIGFSYRTSQEFVGMVNYQLTKELKLGYAYDFNTGAIGNYSDGTHEVIILFNIVNDKVIPIIEVPRF